MSSIGGLAGAASARLARLDDAVDGLIGTDLTCLSDADVLEVMRRVETALRRTGAFTHRLVVDAVERSLPASLGYNSPNKLLVEVLRISAFDASARVGAAKELGIWHTTTGDAQPITLPETAAAQVDGDIGADHARAVGKIMRKVPHSADPTDTALAEKILAECARAGTPEDVETAGHRLLAYLDPDGKITDDKDRARRRGISIGRQDTDLMSRISGELDPTARALLDPILAKWARPGMNNPADPGSPSGDAEHPEVDRDLLVAAAARDTRTAAQRNHDALGALFRTFLESGALGTHRGLPATAIITMTLDQLELAAGGVATSASGGLLPLTDALKLAENAHPVLVLFDHDGRPLHLGRRRRLASGDQRLALIAAEGGCTRPGCGAPPSLCAVHHKDEWVKGGVTDIGSLTLACDGCHAQVNDTPTGWTTRTAPRNDQHAGRTAWIPPPHIDPHRRPRINHRHQAGELLAGARRRLSAREP